MATWHFVAVMCANNHVMMGLLCPAEAVERTKDVMRQMRETGMKSGFFKGRCGNCQTQDLRIDTIDTGCQDEKQAMLWTAIMIERWRSDQKSSN